VHANAARRHWDRSGFPATPAWPSRTRGDDRQGRDDGSDVPTGKLSRKYYEKQLVRLQSELVQLQLWVKDAKAKIVVLFEGRDAAGKGGVIKRITERTSPRVFRVGVHLC
jgi:polyphosphate kinase 2 (PPK2 family)